MDVSTHQTVRPGRTKRRPRRAEITDDLATETPLARTAEYAIYDRAVRGFYLRVGLSNKHYEARAQYRGEPGKIRSVRVQLGRVGVVTADEARERARGAIRSIIATGRADSANAHGGGATVAEVWDDFIKSRVRVGCRPSTVEGYEDIYDRLLKSLHDKPITKLTRADAERLQNEITEGHGNYASNSALRLARAIWNYAADGKELPNMPRRNPFRDDKVLALYHQEISRADRALVPAELPAWRKQVEALTNAIRRELHYWSLLSGMRRRTICVMEWSHVDWDERRLLVPSPKGGKPLYLPLSEPMIESLKRAQEAGTKLFPKQAKRWVWPSGESKSGHVTEVKEREVETTGHALRATYAGFAEMHASSVVIRKMLMGHATGREVGERHYVNRAALGDEARKAQERISAAIVEAAGK